MQIIFTSFAPIYVIYFNLHQRQSHYFADHVNATGISSVALRSAKLRLHYSVFHGLRGGEEKIGQAELHFKMSLHYL